MKTKHLICGVFLGTFIFSSVSGDDFAQTKEKIKAALEMSHRNPENQERDEKPKPVSRVGVLSFPRRYDGD